MPIANTYRFFVAPEDFSGDEVRVEDAALAHQLGRVLRLQAGDRVLLLDGLGSAYEVALSEIGKGHLVGRVEGRAAAGGELPFELTLYLALLRAERFEWALQKAVELGVRRVVPVQFARSLPGERADAKKLVRWRRIGREAAEQACRGLLPVVDPPLAFAAACEQATATDLALILWEGQAPSLHELLRAGPPPADHPAPAASLRPHALTSCALLSGPEGGITPDELTFAREHGIMPTSLGPRILRAETAPLAAIAALVYELE